jgi:hypothetical protein
VSCIKKEATPISLLVLCSLRYLGRGWTFDDLSENRAISIEVTRTFFHVFISYGSTVLYSKYVRSPSTSAEASLHMEEYTLAGFPGAVGSTDAPTHVMLERINFRFRQSHMGFKMTHCSNLQSNCQPPALFPSHNSRTSCSSERQNSVLIR